MKGTIPKPERRMVRRSSVIVYDRCRQCGNEYDVQMMKPLGDGKVCTLCLNLALERKRRDLRQQSKTI